MLKGMLEPWYGHDFVCQSKSYRLFHDTLSPKQARIRSQPKVYSGCCHNICPDHMILIKLLFDVRCPYWSYSIPGVPKIL